MVYLVILRQNHSINHKLNATSIVLWAGTTPGGLQGQGPRRPLHEWPTVKSASGYILDYSHMTMPFSIGGPLELGTEPLSVTVFGIFAPKYIMWDTTLSFSVT